ncbi:uncharacterized protein LOC122668774 [Telopea speciosissima]|uniref:uncharacterized protein LOC122668774 n=1 Tax=Telopea speciosissima TaxID=54955 RepID=UPI001CC70E4E|nr:uncharacterized protein LOC122668774 [Telopea speciosissima]
MKLHTIRIANPLLYGIAVGEGFIARKIPINPACFRCGESLETIGHTLLTCPFARAVWFGSSLSQLTSMPTSNKISDWLQCWNPIFSSDKKLAQARFSLASFLLWFIWKAHNDLIFNNKQWSPQQVISMAEKAHQEFSSVVCKPPSVSVEVEERNFPSSLSWTPPNEPFLKINCDAAWVKNSGKGGLGIIIRDNRGFLYMLFLQVPP